MHVNMSRRGNILSVSYNTTPTHSFPNCVIAETIAKYNLIIGMIAIVIIVLFKNPSKNNVEYMQ